jgi:cell division protein ZapA
MGDFILSDGDKIRVTVEIYGQQYVIVGNEGADHIIEVASMVDEKMREIGKRNPSLDTSKLAVLTAVNAVHEYMKLKEKVEKLEDITSELKD